VSWKSSSQGLGGDYYSTSAGQRERALTSTQVLERSNQRLADVRPLLAQTEVSSEYALLRDNNLQVGWFSVMYDIICFGKAFKSKLYSALSHHARRRQELIF
jgi:hypothetical protein